MTLASLSQLAEQALEDSERLEAAYVANSASPDQPPRMLRHAHVDRASGLAVAALVGVGEAYVTGRTLELRPRVTPGDLNSWPKRRKIIAAEFGIQLAAECASYPAFEGYNEARNAVLHGSGGLTKMQLGWNKNRSISAKLRAASLGDRWPVRATQPSRRGDVRRDC